MRTRSLKVGSIAYWEDRIEARVRQGKGYNIPHARDVISRGQRVLRLVALAEMERFLWPKTASAAAPPTAPAPPATPAKPAAPKERLSLAAPIAYVIEGTALVFGSTGHPRDAHTLQACQASVRCRAFDHQIDRGRVVLAVNHDYHGDPDDALEVLAAQADGALRLWTAGNRLHFKARLRDTKLGREIIAKAKRGEITGMSVRYTPRRQDAYGCAECTLDGELTEISVLTDRSQPGFPGTTCRVLHAPIGLSIHDPEFRALASDTAIGAACGQLRALQGGAWTARGE